ncbi:MAG: 3-oxoacyl-ACP reductase FabG [Clostridia bacterium]|nr:3-oxoacyl-ACP reductase FabG [Clostridia bacterium]
MKTVLVTGGSKGIGRAICEIFLNKGYKVAFCYSKDDEAAKDFLAAKPSTSDKLRCYKVDVSVNNEVEQMVADIADNFGTVDILVNNAAIGCIKLFTDMSEIEWQRILSVNLTGAFNCTSAVLPDMIRKKSGHIINISSMWGVTGASCEVAYSTTKAGLIGMTKALAKEVGPSNIRVNCIAPGVIDTEMNANLSREDIDALTDETPLGIIGTPLDVAKCALFLSESEFITGQVIGVNGGMVI